MTFQYLMTVVAKTKDEIKLILDNANIEGSFLVGNQLSKCYEEYEINCSTYRAVVYNLSNKGVSKNRNFLLNKATADYVTFLDDDMYMPNGSQKRIEETLATLSQYNCVRFNVVSDNKNRPIKFIKKRQSVSFRQLSSFGVCGCFYKRQFLVNHKLLFNEKIGPGTSINHGEDSLFQKEFTNYAKVWCIPEIAFHARQDTSTWQGKQRDLEKELVSHGYIYYWLYGHCAQFMSFLFLITHIKCYPKGTKYSLLRKNMKIGIRNAKEDSK